MLAGEAQRRQERIAALQLELDQYNQKIAALDSAMALTDDQVNPEALGAVKATSERYGGWGGLTQFLEAEVQAAGVAGIDTVQLTLRAACKFSIPLESSGDLRRYGYTVRYALRELRSKRVIENLEFRTGGHKPSTWKSRGKTDSFDELLKHGAAMQGAKVVRT
jgi:hypothetical protein